MIQEKLITALRSLGFSEFAAAQGSRNAGDTGNAFGFAAPGVLISHLDYPVGTATPVHAHPELRITFVRQGVLELSRGPESARHGTGDVVVLLPGEEHALKAPEGQLLLTELVIAQT